MNDMKTPNVKEESAIGRKSKDLERKIQKGFQISKVEEGIQNKFAALIAGAQNSFDANASTKKPKDVFKRLAKAAAKKEKTDWNAQAARQSSIKIDPIGSRTTSIRRHNKSLRRSLLARGKKFLLI